MKYHQDFFNDAGRFKSNNWHNHQFQEKEKIDEGKWQVCAAHKPLIYVLQDYDEFLSIACK